MPDEQTNFAGPKIVFAPDMNETEQAADSFNPAAAIQHAVNAPSSTPQPSMPPLRANVPPASPSDTDTLSTTLDMLNQAEQALSSEIHNINRQETGALDEIKSLVDKAKSIEQREDQLGVFVNRIQERREQITNNPASASSIAAEPWLNALVEQFNNYQKQQSGLPAAPAPVPAPAPVRIPVRPVVSVPIAPAVQPVPAPKPITTTPVIPPTPAEQKIVQAVRANQSPEKQALFDNTAHVYRATDGFGVIICHGKDYIHVADAELIQAGLFVDDLTDIKPAPAEVVDQLNRPA
ncbi:MAG: hypothetical protein WCW27_06405 [Patescibacteria group bacterium]|jgi:hypothetical protein